MRALRLIALTVLAAALLSATAYGAGRAYHQLGTEKAAGSPTSGARPTPGATDTPTDSPADSPSQQPTEDPVEPSATPSPTDPPARQGAKQARRWPSRSTGERSSDGGNIQTSLRRSSRS